jgi:hypothetical protein
MRSITFKNVLNGELVVCDNTKNIETIDGIDYLVVHRRDNPRLFLMRKDVLKKVTDKVIEHK